MNSLSEGIFQTHSLWTLCPFRGTLYAALRLLINPLHRTFCNNYIMADDEPHVFNDLVFQYDS